MRFYCITNQKSTPSLHLANASPFQRNPQVGVKGARGVSGGVGDKETRVGLFIMEGNKCSILRIDPFRTTMSPVKDIKEIHGGKSRGYEREVEGGRRKGTQ